MPTSSPSPRRRGAQLGNLNALKHGFYTRRLRKRDLTDLQSYDFKGLSEEIAALRIFTRRLIERCEPSADFYDTMIVLRTLCLTSSCLNRLVRTQQFLLSQEDPIGEALEEALSQIYTEWGLDEAGSTPASPSRIPDAS